METVAKRHMGTRSQTSNPETFLVSKEAAYILGTSIQFLSKLVRSTNPPPFKRRGRKYLFPRKEFMEWADRDII